MEAIVHIEELRSKLKAARRKKGNAEGDIRVGFMPTLGYMHEGHMSLIRQARRECDIVVVSIFVNPLQFGPTEDFDKYPRDNDRDLRLAEEAGADYVFLPSVSEMYPSPTKTTVVVKELTDTLCGASRPGHFDGVATVVTKLFNIVQPDRAYFGMKDAQQVAVIEQFTQDLNIPVQIVRCETLREPDGLAMSSRNVYLNEEERKQALVLSKSLSEAQSWMAEPDMKVEKLERNIRRTIESASLAVIDYVTILTYPGLEPVTNPEPFNGKQTILVALAVKFGKTRLIDNRIFFS